MNRPVLTLALALSLLAGGAAAAELRPGQAQSVSLNGVTGVAYYTRAGSDLDLVAVVAAGAGTAPIRVEARLAPGETLRLSVPGAAGEAPATLQIVRRGDTIEL